MWNGTPCLVVPNVSHNARGYARCNVQRYGVTVHHRHRLAWIDAHGCLPPDDRPWVLHHCDNPPCENADHLYAGTRTDNIRDMHRRGRATPPTWLHMPGEAAPGAVLTEAIVRAMRAEHAAGRAIRAIADYYGVNDSTARSAIRGKSWTHI